MEKKFSIDTPEGEIILSTGKMAMQAPGTVFLQQGGTVVHVTCTYSAEDAPGDFLPLTFEYIEKMYAAGLISGSRFIKREGRPSDAEMVRRRMVDHSLRPLFPKDLRREVMVVMEVIAFDGIHNPENLITIGASVAIEMSGLPFAGPAASVIVGVRPDGSMVVNPSIEEEHTMQAVYSVAGTEGRILNIEGWSKEVSEEVMDAILDLAGERIAQLCKAETEFLSDVRKPNVAIEANTKVAELADFIKQNYGDKIEAELYAEEKSDVRRQIREEILASRDDVDAMAIGEALDKVERKIMRANVLASEKRLSGRKLDEIRTLSAEVDLLPTVHGSALFSRGQTQSLSIVALGAKSMNQLMDDMWGENEKYFMHHYKMPGYSTGEASRYKSSPNSREIGHGMIGENALRNMIPSVEDFPYTIRVASEIMSSNGSTSMAATCAASMALMAAGVPLKNAIAGIGVGLITADEDTQQEYKLLLDIEGKEDFYGDMDFKVTGSQDGVTAIQFETKLKGVRPEILKQAFRLSKAGRLQVLEAMSKAISASRQELAASAPRVVKMQINPEYIGAVIGPGGKNIKDLILRAQAYGKQEVDIAIEDDGSVLITAANQEQSDYVVSQIKAVATDPEVGAVYEGVIDKVMPYGAFVNIDTPKLTGLIHVSEITEGFVRDPGTIVKEGDVVKVKLISVDDRTGKFSFSIKQNGEAPLPVPPQPTEEEFAKKYDQGERRGGDRGDRGGRRDFNRHGGRDRDRGRDRGDRY